MVINHAQKLIMYENTVSAAARACQGSRVPGLAFSWCETRGREVLDSVMTVMGMQKWFLRFFSL